MDSNSTRQTTLLPLTPEGLRAEADALAAEEAPRRFAVFAMDDDEQDGVILAWGQYFGDGRVVLTGDAAPVHGRFGSLRSALRVCSRGDAQTYVSWVDPAPRTEAVPNRTTCADTAAPDLRAVAGGGQGPRL